ncbi:unnamed protein product [Caenorhabditis angaria]|uniref:Trafficking protein particle complex subunit 11 domain-containing protein n=1 Tax=Caenorhabditis angaria TaxID=860376 RepID=A0A9P1IIS3_9PELO|nr:unnamed protein product [Caenorhabditis angaria]
MDPVEAGDWLAGRPLQLVFISGLDPTNKNHHNIIVNSLRQNRVDKPPLQLRIISGELDLPGKREKQAGEKGILRRDWPTKYLDQIPALIVLFVDLDWNHPSWEEKKLEAESKVASIRSQLQQKNGTTKIALVMLQEKSTNSEDNLAAERAHALCQICSLTPKHLFVLPIHGDIPAYICKLESAFHELAQSFYQQKLKAIRSRNIPNNTPSLHVRQLFKLAFISELRQDTHTALRNYRLAYDQCRDTLEQWDGVDIFEWRSVAGLLNYKMCELCFLHSTALEAVNQMRKHQSIFFQSAPGIYPTLNLASIELLLWKAKQCWHFAQLFDQAVVGGLTALATLNPGTHLDQAASIYSTANTEISALKRNTPVTSPYPTPDPLAPNTVFFGQRPWRVGFDGLATPEIEASAVNAITQRLVINHEGVISLLSAAMSQYKRYNCIRMQKKVMLEMGNVSYANNEIPKALQLWSIVARDAALPYSIRKDIMHRAVWASYAIASVKDFAAGCIQLLCPNYSKLLESNCETAFLDLLASRVPAVPFPKDDVNLMQLQTYQQQWQKVLADRQFFNIQASRIETFLNVYISFLDQHIVEINSKIAIRCEIRSEIEKSIIIDQILVICKAGEFQFDPICLGNQIEVSSLKPAKIGGFLSLKSSGAQQNQIVQVAKVLLEFGQKSTSLMFGQLEFDENSLNRNLPVEDVLGVEVLKITGIKSGVKLAEPARIQCLIGEVAQTRLKLENITKNALKNCRLDFKRNEQKQTEAAAVLFVDQDGIELKSEFSQKICDVWPENGGFLEIDVRFSAQLIGEYDLQLELSYEFEENSEIRKETSNIPINVLAKEPFQIQSQVLNMSGIPMQSILNHCDHILNVQILSADSLIIKSVEFLMADVVGFVDHKNGGAGNELNDEVEKEEIICYSIALRIEAKEDDGETPLGRLAVEWKRNLADSCPVRSVVPLCRIPVIPCPISIHANIKTSPAIVRQPIDICFELCSHHNEAIEITANFDLNDVFMFSGERRITLTVLPGKSRKINVIVMALSAGRLIFPRITLRSPQVADNLLQHALRTLPANIFVLPKSKLNNSIGDN